MVFLILSILTKVCKSVLNLGYGHILTHIQNYTTDFNHGSSAGKTTILRCGIQWSWYEIHLCLKRTDSDSKVHVAHMGPTWVLSAPGGPHVHCPGALLVSILTSNKTWRTRSAVRSSKGDCEKTTQHFAMMSAIDLFVGYIRSSMAS